MLPLRARYIIPTAANAEDRPLKVVRKGNIMNVDHTDIDEMTYEIRMDEYFGAGIAKILNGEAYGTFYAVQIIVDAQSFQNEKRGCYPAQPELGRKIQLKEVFN